MQTKKTEPKIKSKVGAKTELKTETKTKSKSELRNGSKASVTEKKLSKKVSKLATKQDEKKKVVVKRRKTDLKLTKASAVAIVSQANRAKKQALIEKMTLSDVVQEKKNEIVSDTKIPLWVRVFFWFSLMLFCVSFYQVKIRPQLETEIVNIQSESVESWNGEVDNEVQLWNIGSLGDEVFSDDVIKSEEMIEQDEVMNSWTAEKLIQTYFSYMSAGKFDESFALFDSRTQRDKNIRDIFAANKMQIFFDWIEWWQIVPRNIQKLSETYKWKDVYSFDISYVLSSNDQQYDETWKFATNDIDWDLKILMLYCVSKGCSRHPIFWS